jgi:hypothetical protein
MAVGIDPSSIKIWMKDEVYTTIRVRDWGTQRNNKSVIDATVVFTPSADIHIGGRVVFSTQPMDVLVDWQVGFVQLCRDYGCRVRYTGRTPVEGSIVGTMTRQPPRLDCYDNQDKGVTATIPWYRNSPAELYRGGPGSGNTVNIDMGDFPLRGMPATMQNKSKSIYNFLYDFSSEDEFWTILTATSPAKVRQYLGYCHWRVRYKASFIWRFGKPQVSMDWSSFTRLDQNKGDFVRGAPPDIDLQSLLANPVGPLANDTSYPPYAAAVMGDGGDAWSHNESDRGLSPIVLDFWG